MISYESMTDADNYGPLVLLLRLRHRSGQAQLDYLFITRNITNITLFNSILFVFLYILLLVIVSLLLETGFFFITFM